MGLLKMDCKISKRLWRIFSKIIYLIPVICFVGNLACEREGTKASKKSGPPIITSVAILPENPTQGSELRVSIQSQGPGVDATHFRYQWIRNGEEIVGENQRTLKNVNFKKGDVIQVMLTPSDGRTGGEPLLSPSVRIVNTPPVIQRVWIEPKGPSVADSLRAKVEGYDADGDSVYYMYQWEKNGDALNDERKEVLEPGRFQRGDKITVTVTPDDRETLGLPKKSEAVTVVNSAPVITSSPPMKFEGNLYIYQVKANDPDNDPIRFTLKSGPKGMEMNPNTGLIRWEIHKEDKGDHLIEIEASDNAGAKSTQQYTLTIDFR